MFLNDSLGNLETGVNYPWPWSSYPHKPGLEVSTSANQRVVCNKQLGHWRRGEIELRMWRFGWSPAENFVCLVENTSCLLCLDHLATDSCCSRSPLIRGVDNKPTVVPGTEEIGRMGRWPANIPALF